MSRITLQHLVSDVEWLNSVSKREYLLSSTPSLTSTRKTQLCVKEAEGVSPITVPMSKGELNHTIRAIISYTEAERAGVSSQTLRGSGKCQQ